MPEPLPAGSFVGRVAFDKAVADALACAAREGWQEIILSDATFLDWPLRERSALESLQAWSKSGRHMTLLATRFDEIIRHHARLWCGGKPGTILLIVEFAMVQRWWTFRA